MENKKPNIQPKPVGAKPKACKPCTRAKRKGAKK